MSEIKDSKELFDDQVEVAPPRGRADQPEVLLSAFASATRTEIIRKFWRLILTGLAVSLGGMYIGYGFTITGNIVANPGFVQQFGTIQTENGVVLDAFHLAMWNGMIFVGQVVMQAISPFISDRFGRKFSMFALLIFMLIAIVLEIVARDWKVFLAAKILSGCSAAFLGTAVMTYLSEIAITQIRGALLSAFSLSFSLGQLAVSIGLQVLFVTKPYAYVNAFYSQFVIFALFGSAVVYVPESPAWLSMKGRHEDAKKALRRLVGNVEGYDIEHEYAVIVYDMEQSAATAAAVGSSDWASLFKWANLKRCLAATMPFSYQNFAGIPLVFGNTTYFLSLAGLADPFTGGLIISIISNIGIIISFYTVEKLGRRPTVLWSGAALATVNLAIGALSFLPPTSAFGAGLITLCAIWVFIYSLSLAPIGWLSIVEVSSPRLRAKTAAVATVLQSLSNIALNYAVPYMLSPQYAGWGLKIGFFFAGISALWWIPCYFLFPETQGRTYAELDELYASGVPVRKFASVRTKAQDALQGEQAPSA